MHIQSILRLLAILWCVLLVHTQDREEMKDMDVDLANEGGVLVKELKVMELETEKSKLEEEVLFPAAMELQEANANYEAVKAGMPWMGASQQQKAGMQMAEDMLKEKRAEYESAALVVKNVEWQLKPLYGPLSSQLYYEERHQLKESVTMVTDFAYSNTWWNFMFRGTRADSLMEFVVEIVWQFFSAIIMGYPIGFFHFWYNSAKIVSQYSDGSISARFMCFTYWLLSGGVMLLPFIVMGVAVYVMMTSKTLQKWLQDFLTKAAQEQDAKKVERLRIQQQLRRDERMRQQQMYGQTSQEKDKNQ